MAWNSPFIIQSLIYKLKKDKLSLRLAFTVSVSDMCGERDEILAGCGGNVVCWHKMVEAISSVCQLTIIDERRTVPPNLER